MTNKIRLSRSAVTGAVPAAGTAADAGEVSVNYTDGKVFLKDASGVVTVVADRVSAYSASKKYAVGDFCVQAGALYHCNTAVTTPETFNAGKWTSLTGGGGGGDVSGAVILAPMTSARNRIATVGLPAVTGLTVRGDPAQTADLQVWEPTQASDSGKLNIDSLGFPGPRFGAAAFRAGAATHPFTAIGQAVSFNGNWIRKTGTGPTYGLLQEIIDANTIVVRTSGAITNLNAAAFAGGAISNATLYYPSQSVAGQLTTMRPAGEKAVLLTTSLTTGLVLTGSVTDRVEGATIGDAFPVGPDAGALHYRTSGSVGLYIYLQEGGGSQWVQSN